MSNATLALAWNAEGARIGAECDDVTSAVVIGADAEAAARLALGIARVQGRRRRVAVGDLIGGDGVLDMLSRSDDIHGLVDSFLYGVSLNHIARPLEGHANVFILPCGSEAPSEEVLGHPRWRRLTSGFREVGALLLVVAPAGAPGLDRLLAATDGAIIADLDPSEVPGPVIARVTRREATRGSRESASRPLVIPLGDVSVPAETSAASAEDTTAEWPYVERRLKPRPGAFRRALPRLAIILVIAGVGVAGSWVAREAQRRESREAAQRALAAAAARHEDSASAVVGQPPPIPIENADDSASAAAYAIQLATANTHDGAVASLTDEQRQSLPAATVGPVYLAGDSLPWFRVLIGALPAQASADSLLSKLLAAHSITPGTAMIVRVPLALMLDRDLPPDSARTRVRALRLVGIPAYALTQSDGTTRIYAGAFEKPEQTIQLADQLRSAGLFPAVVYRTGRAF